MYTARGFKLRFYSTDYGNLKIRKANLIRVICEICGKLFTGIGSR